MNYLERNPRILLGKIHLHNSLLDTLDLQFASSEFSLAEHEKQQVLYQE